MSVNAPAPVYLFTDFGYAGPYVGQMEAAVRRQNHAGTLIHLMHDAPRMRPDLAAYLLPAVVSSLAAPAVLVAVVDPGVGGARRGVIVETDRLIGVGPDNGLLSRLPGIRRVFEIRWRPEALSASFHGRDLFAPVAAALATGSPIERVPVAVASLQGHDWPELRPEVVYIDGYGNLMLGVPAEKLPENSMLRVAGRAIAHARTFSDVAPGELFWYANSQGLVEIAANQADAATLLSLATGDKILLD
jgi:hypothetical protein